MQNFSTPTKDHRFHGPECTVKTDKKSEMIMIQCETYSKRRRYDSIVKRIFSPIPIIYHNDLGLIENKKLHKTY